MRSILMFGFVFCMLFLMQQSPVCADETSAIHVVCDEWPGFTNKDGTGVYWEIVKTIYEPAGISVKTEVMPWKRADYTVLYKKADAIVGDYYLKEQAGKEFLYPAWHLSVEDPIIAVFKKRTISDWESRGIQSLKGKTVGWIRGYEYDKKEWLNVQMNKYELASVIQGMKMLAVDRLDVLIDYISTIEPEAIKAGINLDRDYDSKVVKLGEKLFLKFANTRRSKQLIKIFDDRMTELAKSGEIDALYQKWGHNKEKFSKERYGKD